MPALAALRRICPCVDQPLCAISRRRLPGSADLASAARRDLRSEACLGTVEHARLSKERDRVPGEPVLPGRAERQPDDHELVTGFLLASLREVLELEAVRDEHAHRHDLQGMDRIHNSRTVSPSPSGRDAAIPVSCIHGIASTWTQPSLDQREQDGCPTGQVKPRGATSEPVAVAALGGAAHGTFGGLIASSWYSAAILMRLFADRSEESLAASRLLFANTELRGGSQDQLALPNRPAFQ